MRALQRILPQLSISRPRAKLSHAFHKLFSTQNGGGPDWAAHFGGSGLSEPDSLGWDAGASTWSTGMTKGHFDGEAVGHQISRPVAVEPSQGRFEKKSVWWEDDVTEKVRELNNENRRGKAFVDSWDDKMKEMSVLMKQVREPGARGSYLKDSEKAEMYKKHKENPEMYTVEVLAKEYRVMRQRVHAILWLKEDEEKEEKKLGHPLDDTIEHLIEGFPE